VSGIEAVLADGSIYKSPLSALGASSGGHAFRWGIGPYIDGLFAQGSFGIVTKMTIALARRPQSVKAFLCGIGAESALEEAVTAVQAVLSTLPGIVGGINVMNAHRVLAMAAPYPHHRLGPNQVISPALLSELTKDYRVQPWTVFGTLYGTRRVVAAAQKEIAHILSPLRSRPIFVSQRTANALQRAIRRVPVIRNRLGRKLAALSSSLELVGGRPNQAALPLAYWKSAQGARMGQLDPGRDGCGLMWYVPAVEMKPEPVRRFVDMVSATTPRYGFEPIISLISASERCFLSTVPLLFDLVSTNEGVSAAECYRELLDLGAEQGFFPYRIGSHSAQWLMARAPDYWKLVSSLKAALDPEDIIAPGRYAPVRASSAGGGRR
jgi:4-cresol dehydrogenase (hydroxylating) flavoprotein subunit